MDMKQGLSYYFLLREGLTKLPKLALNSGLICLSLCLSWHAKLAPTQSDFLSVIRMGIRESYREPRRGHP